MKTMEERTDKELIEDYLAGNENSMAILFNRYRGKVYRQIRGLIYCTKEQAEDLTQESFIKIVQAIKKGNLKDYEKFSPYLWRITRNTAFDFWRKTRQVLTIKASNPISKPKVAHLGRTV